MKPLYWLSLALGLTLPCLSARAQTPGAEVAAPATSPSTASLSAGAAEVLKLASAGTSEDVILAYAQSAQLRFGLTADNILYLKDVGVSPKIIAAMLNHDAAMPAPSVSAIAAPPAPAPALEAMPAPTAPVPQVISQPAPVPAVAPAPVYVSNPPEDVTYFYNDLAPYGTWIQLEGYGWCWQPTVTVVNRAWRPYCDSGHWVYTDSGWCWVSDYAWGWAPFHYGRWYPHPRCGWVWLPDRVWGPAWVTWRMADDHCGWAPLPPHADFDVRLGLRFNGARVAVDFDFGLGIDLFTFVAVGDFNRHDLGHYRLPPERVRTFYSHTTVINNYYSHDKIVNRGVPAERVAAATHTTIRKVEIRDVPSGSPHDMKGGGAVVYRPHLAPPSRPAVMQAQKIDDRHPVVQHAPAGAAPRPGPAVRTENHPATQSSPAPRPESPGVARRDQPSAPNAPAPAPRFQSPAPARTTAPATPAESVSRQPAPSTPAGTPRSAPSTPSIPTTERQTPSARTAPNSKAQYVPKTHQQASEIHSLPPENSRSSDGGGRSSEDSRDSGRRGF